MLTRFEPLLGLSVVKSQTCLPHGGIKPVPVTPAAIKEEVGNFAAENLRGFPLDPAKAIVAAKAAEKAPQIAKTFQVPETIIPKIVKLVYYSHVILCGMFDIPDDCHDD